ncbi:MAG TPA: SGNH/GDSL hydrolase family protein, partial [Candidatus Nitrosopolaris sp.]|nr:SGNH/GDSL hydrolase family protein [Candidatus Nitrosopolaris sp.]
MWCRQKILQMSGVLTVGLAVLISIFALSVQADSSASWLGDAPLRLQQESNLSSVPGSLNGNIDCQQEDGANCVVATLYGSASSSGSIRLNGTGNYYPVFTQIDGQRHFLAVPNSDIGISYSITPQNGLYLYFNHGLSASLKSVEVNVPGGFSWEYHINSPPDGRLQDQGGNLLAADYDSMSFSADGHWMVVTVPNITTVRVNLQTLEVLPFGPGFNYGIGLAPAAQTAISNDGRYAVVASKNFGIFQIYDLSTCAAPPPHITAPVDCQLRDLQSYMQGKITGFINASNIRFISDDVLGVYVSSGQLTEPTVTKYIMNTGANSWHQLDYLTLGDSYISGEGAYDYLAGTDTSDNKCHVSAISYPYLLGRDLDYNSYHSVACSGAITRDILNRRDDYPGQVQLKIARNKRNVSNILGSFLPGYIDQLDFVSQYQPKVVTLSIGGNDMGFSSILLACVEPGTCYNSYEDRLELVQQINNSVFPRLINTYQQIKNAGAPDARIYVIGYPQIAEPGGDCADNVHLDTDEVEFSAQIINYLDNVIQAAAARAGVTYVDTQHALDGHRLCEAASKYEAAVNGLTAGNDRPRSISGPIADESYHPNFIGHELLEQAILQATNGLSEPMPPADPLAGLPAINGLDILNVPKNGRNVNTAEYDPTISDDVIYKDAADDLIINGADHALSPGTNLQAEIHSDAVALGNFTTSPDGNLFAKVSVPDDIADGYHILH